MLNLAEPSDPTWLPRALAQLDEILVDHAHCEKKAASTALALLFRHPERATLLAPLSRLAREELAHFEEVLAALAARGQGLRHQAPSPYAARLLSAARSGEPDRLLDRLLCAALIEARSCERLKLLAESAPDPALAALWRGLLVSEARHHGTYVDLACEIAEPAVVRARLTELARHEANVLRQLEPLPRIHG